MCIYIYIYIYARITCFYTHIHVSPQTTALYQQVRDTFLCVTNCPFSTVAQSHHCSTSYVYIYIYMHVSHVSASDQNPRTSHKIYMCEQICFCINV